MMYKAKDGRIYQVRNATREDIPQIAKVHSVSAQDAYDKFKHKYPDLYNAFSEENLISSWHSYMDKCEQNDKVVGIVVESIYGHKDGSSDNRIVGISKAGMLSPEYKKHMEEVKEKPISEQEAAQYANLQTVYIDPAYQGIGLGKAVVGHFANQFTKKGCQYAITETLSDYQESPKFFAKIGNAECLGEYSEHSNAAVTNDHSSRDEVIPIKLWVMPDVEKMKMNCYFKQKKQQQEAIQTQSNKYIIQNAGESKPRNLSINAMNYTRNMRSKSIAI